MACFNIILYSYCSQVVCQHSPSIGVRDTARENGFPDFTEFGSVSPCSLPGLAPVLRGAGAGKCGCNVTAFQIFHMGEVKSKIQACDS